MTPESQKTPDWARQEYLADSDWIVKDLDVLWLFAARAFDETGPGAIVVDVGVQPIPGAGHPVGYFTQEQIEEKDVRIKHALREYQPTEEFVLVLLRPGNIISAFRVGLVSSDPRDAVVIDIEPSQEDGTAQSGDSDAAGG